MGKLLVAESKKSKAESKLQQGMAKIKAENAKLLTLHFLQTLKKTSGADSNCRKRFCRPSPIRSVTRLS